MIALFLIRFFLYLLPGLLITVHPAVVVRYDRASGFLWFALLPAVMFLAFFSHRRSSPPVFRPSSPKPGTIKMLPARRFFGPLAALSLTILYLLLIGNPPRSAFSVLLLSAAVYFFTFLLFSWQGPGKFLAGLEPLFLISLYVRLFLLAVGQSAPSGSEASFFFRPRFFLFLGLLTTLIFSLLLYRTLFHKKIKKSFFRSRELGILLPFILVLSLGILGLSLPQDFINNIIPPGLKEKRSSGDGTDHSSGKESSGTKNRKQRPVMVVATKEKNLYMADYYYGVFDSVKGFLKTPSLKNPLNTLPTLRLIDTWQDSRSLETKGSLKKARVFSVSPNRYVPYAPYQISPTIENTRYMPFTYRYRFISKGTLFRELLKKPMRSPPPGEVLPEPRPSPQAVSRDSDLSEYLKLTLSSADRSYFETYLRQIIRPGETNFQKSLRLLKSYSKIQYTIGFTDDITVRRIRNFLSITREGDCSEFSNSLALLARLAGIPARVVTGYLASEGLQTPRHKKALGYLRDKIPPLQKYSPDDLLLVTTSHRHSWTQLYLSGYGWVDFDATPFGIPPKPGMNANEYNLVVPEILKSREAFLQEILLLLGKILAVFLLFLTLVLFLFKKVRLYLLRKTLRQASSRASKKMITEAACRILLIRMAEQGYPPKPPSESMEHYSRRLPFLEPFASLYTEIRYSPGDSPTPEQHEAFLRIFRETESTVSRGILRKIRRFLSLKGFRYF